jgi:hypothetical protein
VRRLFRSKLHLHPGSDRVTRCGPALEGRLAPVGCLFLGRSFLRGTRLSWVIASGVVALIVVASVDALRSPDNEAAASATTETPKSNLCCAPTRKVEEEGKTQDSPCLPATTFGSGTPDRTFTGDGDGLSANSEDGYSFTYPGEWARRGERDEVDRRGWYGRFFTTAFAPDAETACASGFAPDLARRLPGRGISRPAPMRSSLFKSGTCRGTIWPAIGSPRVQRLRRSDLA